VFVVLEERACEIGGIAARYWVAGSGDPTVLVHGLGGSRRWWEPVVEPLAERLQLHLVDLPGFGSARGRPFVLRDAPAYVRALLGEVGLERVNLIGHSLGGAVCARFAALWPDMVDRLVLVAPAGLRERERPIQYALPIAAALRQARPRFLRTAVGDSIRAGFFTVYRAGTQLLGDDALRGELSSIQAPTLLLWGERDPIVRPPVAQEYERAIKGAELVILAGAGHVPMFDQAEAFAAAVLGFFAGLSD
jgi:pimeloyl-ACP methyl ester carboxylesterase